MTLGISAERALDRIQVHDGPDVAWTAEGRTFQLQHLGSGPRLEGRVDAAPGGCHVFWERKRSPFPLLEVLIPAALSLVLLSLFFLPLSNREPLLQSVGVGLTWVRALYHWVGEARDDSLERTLEQRLVRP